MTKRTELTNFINDLKLAFTANTLIAIKVPKFLITPLYSRFAPTLRNYPSTLEVVIREEPAYKEVVDLVVSWICINVLKTELMDFLVGYNKVLDLEETIEKEIIKKVSEKIDTDPTVKWTYESYAEETKRTRNTELNSTDWVLNTILGLAGECGELVELVKKELYHKVPMARDAVIKELGDQHYYWTEAVSALGSMLKFNVQDVIAANSKKLRDRYPNGFIPGGGKREESGNKSYKPSSVQVFLDDLITKLNLQ
jgi:NTP pyrophosphatase (non-canonical NTP hydrolase)